MAGNVEPIQELHAIAVERGFGPPSYGIVKTDNESYKCVMHFFAYTIEATATTEEQSLNVCSSNMLIFWKSPDEFKRLCSKELNVTIHYEELHKANEGEEMKKSRLNDKDFRNRTMYPVSYLYEFAVRTNNKIPEFMEVAHPNKQFSVVCYFMGKNSESECMSSKKTARHNAALKMIELIGLDIPSEVKVSSIESAQNNEEKKNYIGILLELAEKHKEDPPIFELIDRSGPQHRQEFQIRCSYLKISAIGYGKTKKEAKSAAAAQVFSRLQTNAVKVL